MYVISYQIRTILLSSSFTGSGGWDHLYDDCEKTDRLEDFFCLVLGLIFFVKKKN